MSDFDTLLTDTAPAFMGAFGKEKLATYYPYGRTKVEGIKVIYDPETIAFDPEGGADVLISPQITVETVKLSEKPKQKDELDVDGMRLLVLQNEGDHGGLTTLSVRIKSNE